MVEMKTKSVHTWTRVQDLNESIKSYTHIPGITELGRSNIEKATLSFETIIRLLSLTRMIRNRLRFKLGRSWYSHAAEREFRTRQAARRAISESPGNVLKVPR